MKANILCAGMGTRFRPFTFLYPKTFIKIGGIPLIERTITQLHADNITDITIVVGYKHEKFSYLIDKYNVEIVVSSEYETKNNNTSLKLIRHRLEDSLIIDGDMCLQRQVLPLIDTSISQFLSQKILSGTEWGLEHDKDMRITKVHKGSPSGYAMTGVSFWTGEAARLLSEEILTCSDEEYWEDAAIRVLEKTPVYITKSPQYAVEIDSLYDAISAKLLTADEVAAQCCGEGLVEKLKGLTNSTYKIKQGQEEFVLRIPGEGTDKIIDRSNEEFITSLLDGHNITPPTTFYSGGLKTMPFLTNHRILTKETLNEKEVIGVAHKLRDLHSIKIKETPDTKNNISILSELELYENLVPVKLVEPNEKQFLYDIAHKLDADEHVICHRDLLLENILINGDDIQLIDFEYACLTSKYWDIVSFLTESRIDGSLRTAYLEAYGNLDMRKVLEAEILVDYIWSLWGFYQSYYSYARTRMSMFDIHMKEFLEKYPFSY